MSSPPAAHSIEQIVSLTHICTEKNFLERTAGGADADASAPAALMEAAQKGLAREIVRCLVEAVEHLYIRSQCNLVFAHPCVKHC